MLKGQKFTDYSIKYIKDNYNASNSYIVTPTSLSKNTIVNRINNLGNHNHNDYTAYTLEELCYKFIAYNKADDLELTLELCKILIRNGIKKQFTQLYFIARHLLEEFNEIDIQLVNTTEYFQYLRRYYQKFTHNEQFSYMPINILESIYIDFNKYLQSINTCYRGLAFRLSINNKIASLYKTAILIGFNELTNGEKRFLSRLQENNKAIFLWDYDNLYFNNTMHEAGYYLRKNVKDYTAPDNFTKNLNSNQLLNKKIKILQCKNMISEIKEIINILKKNPNATKTRTAIIINNPAYAYLYAHYIVKAIPNSNIIYEKSIVDTLLSSFLDLLYSINTNNTNQNFIQSVKYIFSHNYIKYIYNQDYEGIINIAIEDTLPDYIYKNPLLATILNNKHIDTPKGSLKYLIDIFNIILKNININTISKQDINILKECLLYLERLYDTIKNDVNIKDNEALKLIIKLLKSHKIPQEINLNLSSYIIISNLYQTPVLDFDNIICTDMNENNNIFKSTNNAISTYNIKKAFKLRTFEDKNRVESYLFYRLLQSASNIHLLYKEQDIDSRQVEPNRYINQIKYEHTFNNSLEVLSSTNTISGTKRDIIINTSCFKNILSEQINLSATALINLLECPLKFYLKYILKIKTTKNDNANHIKFGNAFHRTMEFIYKPYTDKVITESVIDIIKTKVDQDTMINLENLTYKINSIEKRVLLEYIIKTLDYDLKKTPFKIKHIELPLSYTLNFNIDGHIYNIKINGIIDRVDEYNNRIEIIDYKTGNSRPIILDDCNIEDINNIATANKPFTNYDMQTLIYHLLYSKSIYFDENKPIFTKLLNIKSLFETNQNINDCYHIKNSITTNIESFITKKLMNLFKHNNVILSTEDKENICRYCDYKDLCNI